MRPVIVPIKDRKAIPPKHRRNPVGLLLEYHNFQRPFEKYEKAQILIAMCMDNRKHLRIPDQFAYIIRSGGGNLRYSEFKVSYAIAIGGIRHIALLGHDHCGMVNIVARKQEFIDGLVTRAGWDRQRAEEHFMNLAPLHEIDNEVEFVLHESHRLQKKYPKITVAPLYYHLDTNTLSFIDEK